MKFYIDIIFDQTSEENQMPVKKNDWEIRCRRSSFKADGNEQTSLRILLLHETNMN